MKTKYTNEQGFCPRCKGGNLNYEAIRLENDWQELKKGEL